MTQGMTLAAAVTPARDRMAGAPANALAGAVVRVRTIWLLVGLTLALAWWVARQRFYTPGSDFGYALGLVGGIAMLLLFLYPLRKHVRFLNRLGALRHWFWLHMLLGVTGPVLILFHSNLHLGSLNASIAFWSMVLVAGSGVIGRFIYTKIHHGLYGRKAGLDDLRHRLGFQPEDLHSRFAFAPGVESRVRGFESRSLGSADGALATMWHFLSLGGRRVVTEWRCRIQTRRALNRHARTAGWPRAKRQRRIRIAHQYLHAYLVAVQDVAQFSAYERMFSWWHILHVPFVYMLVASSVFHVVAVHMY